MKILSSRAALEGERKQVTVLFADVKGSMELAEHLGPEDWHAVLDRFFRLLTDGVHRFEGTVNQYTGDGIMALFGAPIAHEDHAERACRAALHLVTTLRDYGQELRRTRGVDFAVRMGLNSGEVVVGTIGDDLRMDYTAQGHTVGLAQRVEQLAAPGRAYLTERTAALVAARFALKDLGDFTLKGAAEPLRVFELVGAGALRTRLDVARARGFSAFVGRADEMAALETALGRAVRGSGQVVGLVADPGVGKSRLCHEFAERCRARGLAVTTAHGVAHGRGIPLLPVLEWLRGYFAIADADPATAAREKIATTLLRLDPAFAGTVPLVCDFLGVGDPAAPVPRLDPEVRQRLLFAATRHLLHAGGRHAASVAILEDLHWIDAASEAFLANFVDGVAGTPTLVVVTFRPEYHGVWMRKSYYQQLPLAPLAPMVSAALLRELLGDDPSVAPLADRISLRTGGNPFFIEEIMQSLVEARHLEGERGAYRLARVVADDALPPTIQAVLASRIDRLGEREKSVLHTAAVIGKEFAGLLLRQVVELPDADLAAALASLTGAELLYETAAAPAAEYAFKHPLTQEVAYRTQLGQRRARTHAAVARAIADLDPGRLEERAAVLAHHWEAAGEPLQAARWHRRAATWAGMNDAGAALDHWQRVRSLLDPLPESPENLALGLETCAGILGFGWCVGMSDTEADRTLEEGRRLAARLEAPAILARMLLLHGAARGNAGDLREFHARAAEAAAIAAEVDDAALSVGVALANALAHSYSGNLPETLAWLDRGIALSRPEPRLGADIVGFAPHPWFLYNRATMFLEAGRFAEAEHELDLAAAAARAIDSQDNFAWIEGVYAILAAFRGEAEAALERTVAVVHLAETFGTSYNRAYAQNVLSLVHLAAEQWAEALAASERALALASAGRTTLVLEGWIRAQQAEALLGLGDHERAGAMAAEAIAVAERIGTRFHTIEACVIYARVLLRAHGAAARREVEHAIARATALMDESGLRGREPWLHLLRAELAGLLGDDAARRHALAEAHRVFTAMGAPRRADAVARALAAARRVT